MRCHELARTLAEFAEARAPFAFTTKMMDPHFRSRRRRRSLRQGRRRLALDG
jgi:hypothetical protein